MQINTIYSKQFISHIICKELFRTSLRTQVVVIINRNTFGECCVDKWGHINVKIMPKT